MERNIFSLGETLNRFIEASREQIRNEGRYSTRQSLVRGRYKGSHKSRSSHRRNHVHRQSSEYPISLAAFQSDIEDGSESGFDYHNPPAVSRKQNISSQFREANSNVKDQGVDT